MFEKKLITNRNKMMFFEENRRSRLWLWTEQLCLSSLILLNFVELRMRAFPMKYEIILLVIVFCYEFHIRHMVRNKIVHPTREWLIFQCKPFPFVVMGQCILPRIRFMAPISFDSPEMWSSFVSERWFVSVFLFIFFLFVGFCFGSLFLFSLVVQTNMQDN